MSAKKTAEAKANVEVESVGDIKAEFVVDDKDYAEIVLHGVDLGFANLLVEKLLEGKSVGFASADYLHPTKRTPLLKIKGKNIKKLVADALKTLESELKGLSA